MKKYIVSPESRHHIRWQGIQLTLVKPIYLYGEISMPAGVFSYVVGGKVKHVNFRMSHLEEIKNED